MINSMTAFARECGACSQGALVVELRSVNHRYLDCSFKLPEQLRGLEPGWRDLLRSHLSRGKVECQLRWQAEQPGATALVIDGQKLQSLLQAIGEVEQLLENPPAVSALDILLWPGILEQGESGADEVLALATEVFKQALAGLADNRAREGAKLGQFIGERLQRVNTELARVRSLLPELLQQQRQRIEKRLAEIDTELEPQRLEQELVLQAHKADVGEELDRLQVHVEEVERVLAKGGPCGRRLDFLMQELNREANTLSAKSISNTTTQNAVELKVLIEQMREQIQNLE
ncbi:MAG: YicC family protein [Gammaproteobacteria bacterium]|nr:YicC family protein [Gammaproteobacteria bacterium]